MLPLSECRSPYQSRCLNKEFRTIELALGGVDLYGNFKLQGTSDRAGTAPEDAYIESIDFREHRELRDELRDTLKTHVRQLL